MKLILTTLALLAIGVLAAKVGDAAVQTMKNAQAIQTRHIEEAR
jgi:hypothetical protein